jgi:1-acyl-sn-glycerol-3-phosphate acyltransferase
MNRLAACWKLWRVFTHVLGGVLQGGLLFRGLSQRQRYPRIRQWALIGLKRLRIRLKITGAPAHAGPMLLVANHTSWVDILALLAVCPCRFVAKADVAHWPLLGTIVTGGGTLYVKRESRRDTMRVVYRMAEALKDGDIVGVFPEGTTSDGSAVLPFHAGLIQAAISAGAPVQPVALQIVDDRSGKLSRAASYTGDESILGSIWRTLCARDLCVVVTFGTEQLAAGRDRHAWARDLQQDIVAMREAANHPLPS